MCSSNVYDHSNKFTDASGRRENPEYDVVLGRGLSGIEWEGGNPSIELYAGEFHNCFIEEGEECARGVSLCKDVGGAKQAQVDGCSKPDNAKKWKLEH